MKEEEIFKGFESNDENIDKITQEKTEIKKESTKSIDDSEIKNDNLKEELNKNDAKSDSYMIELSDEEPLDLEKLTESDEHYLQVKEQINIAQNAYRKKRIIKGIILGIVLLFAIFGTNRYLATKEVKLDRYVNYSKNEIEKKLDIKLRKNSNKENQIPCEKDSFDVFASGNLYLIMNKSGKQIGIGFDNTKKYTLFGIKAGMTRQDIGNKITYKYNYNNYSIMDTGNITNKYYFGNDYDNTCMIIFVNDITGRVVAVYYFNSLENVLFEQEKV